MEGENTGFSLLGKKMRRHFPVHLERFVILPELLPLNLYVLVSAKRAMPLLMEIIYLSHYQKSRREYNSIYFNTSSS